MVMTFEQFKQLFVEIADRIEQVKDELSELDRQLGDGDHGVTMSIGWQAIVDKIRQSEASDCGALLKEIAMAFLNAVGSSVGPLYATAFLRGSAALPGKTELTHRDLVSFWEAAIQGIQERGKAKIGDKTMMDTWLPVLGVLKTQSEKDEIGKDIYDKALAEAENGMNATASLVSQLGRSSRLGDRSVGHMDPGAVSAYYIFQTFVQYVRKVM
ncbi:dihydroxyacetone kinase subunit DhaL [Paenibacillus cisolokensis]|uniref:dihydroxyacetone kinase subunit DhaL n=1 Tax=Paenibacillus cisolokensis TaxID=1658519 RepID=UPI003D29D8D3